MSYHLLNLQVTLAITSRDVAVILIRDFFLFREGETNQFKNYTGKLYFEGALPYFEDTLCKAFKTPFSAHSSPKGSLKLCSVAKIPTFSEFLIKNYKFVTQRPIFFFFLYFSIVSCEMKTK